MADLHPLMAELADTRRAGGVPQKTIARRLNVSRSTVATWETGSRQPTLATAAAYAQALGLELEIHIVDNEAGAQ
jgi:transcriptional regulator with XRE-family HTH domain